MLKFYTKKPCVQCNAVQRWLDKRGLVEGADYEKHPLDDLLVDSFRQAGYLAAPILIPEEGEGWAGFRPDLLEGYFDARA